MRRLALVCLIPCACFNPSDAEGDTEFSTGSTSVTGSSSGTPTSVSTTTPGTTTSATGSTTDPSGSSSTTTATSSTAADTTSGSTSDESGSTTDFLPGCDNGVVEDDELCFEDAVALDTPVSGQGVAIADLDGDNHLDIVVGDYGDGTTGGIRAYLGNGDGSFGDAIPAADTNPVVRVSAGSIADGVVDVIAMRATANPGTLRFRGNDDGTFGSPATYVEGSNWDVHLAELDGDTRLDAIGTFSGVTVMFANASEGFGSIDTYYAGENFNGVKAFDLDGGGGPADIVASSSQLHVLTNNGSGTFSEGTPFGTSSSDVIIGDFDGDGLPDLAGVAASITVYINDDGNGGFTESETLSVQANPIAGEGFDVDDDGFDDIISLNTGGTVSILLSNGDGTFAQQEVFNMLEGYLYDMAIGDLNEDGGVDIVTVAPNGAVAQLLLSHV